MLERMQTKLIDSGSIQASGLPGIFLCKDARPTVSTNSVDFSISDIDNLGYALSKFATQRGMQSPATAPSWPEIILPFFLHSSPPGDKAMANVKGVMIADPKSVDFAIVADFIMDQWRSKAPIYQTIERLYYGVLAANFLTQIEITGDKTSFKGLNIIYDTPVMLRLLGCSGTVFREATEELHETLRDLGCRTYYFSHTYDETAATIEAMVKCYENGQPLFRDTQEAIANGEISISQIYGVRSELDLRLAALGLTEFSRGYSNRQSDDFQIDEDKFQARLERNRRWGADGSLAAERDTMSLALIMRLREGKEVREVAKARFIFLTHNPALAVRAKEFLREERQLRDGSVWPIMTVGQLSTIAWVVNEVFQDDRRITKELIADCYAAALPDEDFDQKLKDVLVGTDPTQAHELYRNAFVMQSVRQVALEQTGGHSSLVKTLNTAELLATAAEVRERAIADARRDERAQAETDLLAREQDRREEKVSNIATWSARGVMALFLTAAVIIVVWQSGAFSAGQSSAKVLSGLLVIVGIYSAADLFGFTSAASLSRIIENLVKLFIRKLQRALS